MYVLAAELSSRRTVRARKVSQRVGQVGITLPADAHACSLEQHTAIWCLGMLPNAGWAEHGAAHGHVCHANAAVPVGTWSAVMLVLKSHRRHGCCPCTQVSAAERENARSARLDALENDDAGGGEGVTGDSDEEFVLQDSDDGEGSFWCASLAYGHLLPC